MNATGFYEVGVRYVEVGFAIACGAVFYVTFRRHGLLSAAVMVFTFYAQRDLLMSIDFSTWYAGRSLLSLAGVALLGYLAFRTAVGRQSILGPRLLQG